MLMPIRPQHIEAGALVPIITRPSGVCRPLRLLLGHECARHLQIHDIKIGNMSYTITQGTTPGIHFSEEIKDLASVPKLDLGITSAERPIVLDIENTHTARIQFTGSWECEPATEPELLEAFTSPYQKEILKKYDRALVILEELTKHRIMK